MIDNRIVPQVMCAACGHIFPTDISVDIPVTVAEEVTCPTCETVGKPKGIMQPSGFPSLETFKRNWQRSTSLDIDPSKTLAKSSKES